jgi:hypothetical protein
MRNSLAFGAALMLCVDVGISNAASALDRNIGQKLPPPTNKVSHLTINECAGLGGQIEVHGGFPTDGSHCAIECQVANQSGVVRTLCVDGVKH